MFFNAKSNLLLKRKGTSQSPGTEMAPSLAIYLASPRTFPDRVAHEKADSLSPRVSGEPPGVSLTVSRAFIGIDGRLKARGLDPANQFPG